MQHNPPPYPPPDVHPDRAQAQGHSRPPEAYPATSRYPHDPRAPHPRPHTVPPNHPQDQRGPPPQPPPDFLIIGLFALRLARRLILNLDPYPERNGDIEWLDSFLMPYTTSYDLAKVIGSTKRIYLQTYPEIVARMKAQRRYPLGFMALNPVAPQRREALSRRGGLTDAERWEIIDFADAAGEWGSIVHVPHGEAERMSELADQRRIADLERRLGDERGGYATENIRPSVDRYA